MKFKVIAETEGDVDINGNKLARGVLRDAIKKNGGFNLPVRKDFAGEPIGFCNNMKAEELDGRDILIISGEIEDDELRGHIVPAFTVSEKRMDGNVMIFEDIEITEFGYSENEPVQPKIKELNAQESSK